MTYILNSEVKEDTFIMVYYSHSLLFVDRFRYVIEQPIFNGYNILKEEVYCIESSIKIVHEKKPFLFLYHKNRIIID